MSQSLRNLRQWCMHRKIPLISVETEVRLKDLLQEYRPMNILEIGSAAGYSTAMISEQVDAWQGHVYSFEIAYNAYVHACRNTRAFPYTTVYPRDASKIHMEQWIPNAIDFAFIDGQKNQYGSYLQKIENLLCPGAIVVLDDVIKFHNKLSSLYEYLQQKQIFYRIEQLEDDDGIMICQL